MPASTNNPDGSVSPVNAVEIGGALVSAANPLPVNPAGFATLMDYDTSGNLIYVGTAVPGTAASAALWSIKKLTYSGANVTAVLWAGGSVAAANVWNNRTSLSYA